MPLLRRPDNRAAGPCVRSRDCTPTGSPTTPTGRPARSTRPTYCGKADFTLDELGWQLLSEPEVQTDWDGLTGTHPALGQVAGRPDAAYHQRWLRTLGVDSAA